MIAAGMSGELVADLVRRLVERLGGRWSRGLGIDVDEGDEEVDRWALAATLFGNRISAAVVERTYRVLAEAGVATIADAGERSWDELVELLDRGGYVRYDFRTASRLLALARAVAAEHGGRVASLGEALRDPAELEAALDALPGWGPMTVRVFLRELRGLWPGAELRVDDRALAGAEHLGLLSPGRPHGAPRPPPAARRRRRARRPRPRGCAHPPRARARAEAWLSGRGGLRDPSAGTRPVGPGRY